MELAVVELIDAMAYPLAFVSEFHADRPLVGTRPLVIDVARFDKLLEIVRDVGALIVAARLELARRQLGIADIEEEERLNRVDLGLARPLEIILDDVEKAPMQPLDQHKRFEIFVLDMLSLGGA